MSETNTSVVATPEQFAVAMQGVAWWATSTQQEQLAVQELYDPAMGTVEEYAVECSAFASAAELLDCPADDGDEDEVPPAEPVPTVTLVQCNATLAAFGKQLAKQGQGNYKLAAIAAEYVAEFLAVSPGKNQRSTAVERLAGEWLLWDEESMSRPQTTALKALRERVNMLLRGNAVATLLGTGKGLMKSKGECLPWGTLREFAPLVERDADEHAERWHVQPFVADKAMALLESVAAEGTDRKDVPVKVQALVVEEATARGKLAAEQRAAEQAKAASAREQEMADRKVLADAKRVADAAEAAAKAPDATPEVVAQAVAAVEVVKTATAAVDASTAAATVAKQVAKETEEQERVAKGKQADAEAKAAEKERRRVAKANGQATSAPPTPTANQGTNLLASAAKGTPKDVAAMVYDLFMGSEEPDTLLETVLHGLNGCKELSKVSHRAIKAALVVLATPTVSVPVHATSNNGQLVTA